MPAAVQAHVAVLHAFDDAKELPVSRGDWARISSVVISYVERGDPLPRSRLVANQLFAVLLEVLAGGCAVGTVAPSQLRAVLAEQCLPLARVFQHPGVLFELLVFDVWESTRRRVVGQLLAELAAFEFERLAVNLRERVEGEFLCVAAVQQPTDPSGHWIPRRWEVAGVVDMCSRDVEAGLLAVPRRAREPLSSATSTLCASG